MLRSLLDMNDIELDSFQLPGRTGRVIALGNPANGIIAEAATDSVVGRSGGKTRAVFHCCWKYVERWVD